MPSEMIGAGENVSGGFQGRGRPMYNAAGGPWEITQQQEIGAGVGNPSGHASMDNDRTTTAHAGQDPRCQCIAPYDPRTQVR